jgi:hypothetical protein
VFAGSRLTICICCADLPNGSEVSLGGGGSWHAGMDFREKCRRIVDHILNYLGEKDAYVFDVPVDGRAVLDYYSVITEPICFQDIKKKLNLGAAPKGYQSPQEFYDVSPSALHILRP